MNSIRKDLAEIAIRRNYTRFLESLPASEDIDLRIGFVGEFSAGKSSLLNALIGDDLLPAMPQPTTSSIVELMGTPMVEAPEFYVLDDEHEPKKVKRAVFEEVAAGASDGHGLVLLPSNDIFSQKYRFVDTPGLSSTHQSHTDLTVGFLPSLDGLVVCLDVYSGGINQTLARFLRGQNRVVLEEFTIFAITKTDQVPHSQAILVQQRVISDLVQLVPTLTEEQISERVILTSARRAMHGDAQTSGLENLKRVFDDNFYHKKSALLARRELDLLGAAAKTLESILREESDHLALDDAELSEKQRNHEQRVEELTQQLKVERQRFGRLEGRLSEQLLLVVLDYRHPYQHAKDSDEIERVTRDLVENVSNTISSVLGTYSMSHRIEMPNAVFSALEQRVHRIIENTNRIALIATMVATAAIGPLSGKANVAEATAGGLMKRLGETAEKIAHDQMKDGKLKNVALPAIRMLAAAVEDINPISWAGEKIASPFKQAAADQELRRIADRIASNVMMMVEEEVERDVIKPLQDELRNEADVIEGAQKLRMTKHRELATAKKELDADIRKARTLYLARSS